MKIQETKIVFSSSLETMKISRRIVSFAVRKHVVFDYFYYSVSYTIH